MASNRPTEGIFSVEAIEAKSIYLVDGSGTTRASMNCASNEGDKRGHVVIHLYDQSGRPRLTVQVDDEEGASIALFNQNNSPCVSLGAFNNRGNGVTICDNEGLPRLVAGVGDIGDGETGNQLTELTVINSEGKVVWSLDG